MRTSPVGFGLAAAPWIGATALALARDRLAEFRRGEQVRVIVGFAAGGNSGLYGEVLGRRMGKHFPGSPLFVPQCVPGGRGLVAANHKASCASRDGTEIAITSRMAASEPMPGSKQAQFNVGAFNWPGSAEVENGACVADAAQPARTFHHVGTTEIMVSGQGVDAILERAHAAPPKLIDRATELLHAK